MIGAGWSVQNTDVYGLLRRFTVLTGEVLITKLIDTINDSEGGIVKKRILSIILSITTIVFGVIAFSVFNVTAVLAETTTPNTAYASATEEKLTSTLTPMVETPEIIVTPENLTSDAIELSYMKEFNNKLLDTFFASLGFVGIFLVGFLGLNWFQNNKKIEIEMNKLKTDLLSTQKDEFSRLAALSDQKNSQIKASVDNNRKELTEKIDDQIKELKIQLFEKIADDLVIREEYGNALTSYLSIIETDPNYWGLAYILENLLKLIQNKEMIILPTEYSEITNILNSISEEHRLIKIQLLEALSDRIKSIGK